MAFLQFPSTLSVLKFTTEEAMELGQLQFTKHGEIKHLRTRILMHGTAGGNERFKMGIHLTDDLSIAYAESNWVSASAFDTSTGVDDWMGWVRFDFDRQALNKNQTYYISCTIDNYTRNSNTDYAALVYDYPYGTYTDDSNPANSIISLQAFMYQESS